MEQKTELVDLARLAPQTADLLHLSLDGEVGLDVRPILANLEAALARLIDSGADLLGPIPARSVSLHVEVRRSAYGHCGETDRTCDLGESLARRHEDAVAPARGAPFAELLEARSCLLDRTERV